MAGADSMYPSMPAPSSVPAPPPGAVPPAAGYVAGYQAYAPLGGGDDSSKPLPKPEPRPMEVQAPPPPTQPSLQPWSTGQFDCCSDCGICCMGFWCLPCLYGSNVSKVTGGSCCCNCIVYAFLSAYIGLGACCVAGPNRSLLRKKYNLKEDDCGDCMAHFLCLSSCAVCQEARELKVRALQA